jgi:endonuclease YncB( thermonuclease family)
VRARIHAVRGALGGLGALLASLAAAVGGSRGDGAPAERVELVEVIDGDGLRVRRAGRLETLRLACVDCEESLHESDRSARDKPQTVLGERARLWLAHALAPRAGAALELELRFHEGEPERDGFGRLLAHARAPGGSDLGLELVRAGHSPYFVKYGTCPLSDREYRAAERKAREARRGIWSAEANRPATPGAPRAGRDYERLSAWWTLRAQAVAGYRAARARDPLAVARADDPGELARAAAGGVAVFVEVVAARERDDGALELSCAGDLLSIEVPAAARVLFAPLDLQRRSWSGRANHLWLLTPPASEGRAWRARAEHPGALSEAGSAGPPEDP